MKSIGEHLKAARDEKGFSFDQVVHDTNISKEYINALETDNFDLFPAEAYLIGFLRNYSEYLGLDPSKMVGIYKNFKISEEPVPMDLLFGKKISEKKEKEENKDKPSKRFMWWILPVSAIIVIAAIASFLFIPALKNIRTTTDDDISVTNQSEPEPQGAREFFLTEETLDIKVFNGDKINVSTGSKLASFSVQISENEKSLIYLDMENQLRKMNLQKDDAQVIRIDKNSGVYFDIKEVSAASVTLIAQKVATDKPVEAGDLSEETRKTGLATSFERISEKIVITTEVYPQAFTIDIFFRGDGLFCYKNDEQQRIEKYFEAGDRLRIEVNRTVVMWVSNAGIVDIKISGKEVVMGKNGQVVVRAAKWIKNNETGKYELILVPVD